MRLIDADALKEDINNAFLRCLDMQYVKDIIDNAPTVDIKAFANITFDKDELEQIVRDKVIEPIKNGELVVKAEERPTGHWFLLDECSNEGVYCSNCHKKVYRVEYANQKVKSNFCPNCGADMRGKENE